MKRRQSIVEVATLEARRLMSVTQVGQQLRVVTGATDDTIVVSQADHKLTVNVNGQKTTKNVLDFDIQTLLIDSGGGKDNILVKFEVEERCTILAGNGNDKVQCYDQGGDELDGGGGTDTLSYESQSTTAYITPDNVRNDGTQVGNDNIHPNFEKFIGSEAGDQIFVSNLTNATVFGGGGNDTIKGGLNGPVYGEGGFDTFFATDSTGSNDYFGGAGDDAITYTGRTKALKLSLDVMRNDGEAGEQDYISGDIEEIIGGSGNDTITGDAFDNILSGFSGNDSIIGNAGNDTLNGSIGNDTLIGGLGADDINGNSGVDLVSYVGRTKPLVIRLTNTTDSGEAGENDSIGKDVEKAVGGSSADTFFGNDSNNTFSGGAGDDTMFSSKGNDVYFGGTDFDTVTYANAPSAVKVSIDGVANDGTAGESDNIAFDVEHLTGSDFDDVLSGDDDRSLLIGGKGNDTLHGNGGEDTFIGGAGADVFDGGAGFDQANYGDRTEDLKLSIGDGANDGAVNEHDDIQDDVEDIESGQGNDLLVAGSTTFSILAGNGGNDTMIGGPKPDTFFGGPGTDLVDYSGRSDKLTLNMTGSSDSGATDEHDTISDTVENLIAGSNNDTVTGNDSPNDIAGGDGNDSISGGKGNDTIHGGNGKDTLVGGAGQDKLYGDSNNDKFKAQDGEKDTLNGGGGTDSILDKDNNDVLSSVP